MSSAGRLQGKVALVTGAGCIGPGWGNGRAIAVRFAEEGAHVIAVDRDLASMDATLELVRAAGGSVTPCLCDVTDSASVERLVADSVARCGRVDILVNNVGAPSPGGPVALDEAQWAMQLELNLTTAFLMCKYVLPVMEQQGGGAIVNIASTSGIRWTGAAQVGYAAAKAGMIQMGRVVAVEYAAKNVRVNSVVPGLLHTPMVDTKIAHNQAGGDVELLLRKRQARIPMPFMGDGRDTANAALFLASDEARFVTGTEIVVDGGMSARCD
ncbi:short chain dehydrogenase family protein [Paraburkholderia xenovorans LB400]|uniref:Short-chain dehydrogenase/reductase n=1 Tax=Paraburkholderia xenovorans (strain LB400) TaxID=266265 RepID=Q13GE3_PARXL|nr:SDR family NAD(P)-dependent oxidoreductase [Paraburkholderia xenovorans]ABE36846.1 Putative short-chain dehydrogenase/reductase [Paraburkholderia xenovorans LB400]AIP33954.1 short chain dehydrogenase family protein [Paraburkholderia xenovorans LB400]